MGGRGGAIKSEPLVEGWGVVHTRHPIQQRNSALSGGAREV